MWCTAAPLVPGLGRARPHHTRTTEALAASVNERSAQRNWARPVAYQKQQAQVEETRGSATPPAWRWLGKENKASRLPWVARPTSFYLSVHVRVTYNPARYASNNCHFLKDKISQSHLAACSGSGFCGVHSVITTARTPGRVPAKAAVCYPPPF
jgi:hypothetical protein